MDKENFNRRILKMTPLELEEWLKIRNKASKVSSRKGKGSYKRKEKYAGRSIQSGQ